MKPAFRRELVKHLQVVWGVSMRRACAFEGGSEARKGIGEWIRFYNERRPHSSLDERTPDEVYTDPGGIGSNWITPYMSRQPVQTMGTTSEYRRAAKVENQETRSSNSWLVHSGGKVTSFSADVRVLHGAGRASPDKESKR